MSGARQCCAAWSGACLPAVVARPRLARASPHASSGAAAPGSDQPGADNKAVRDALRNANRAAHSAEAAIDKVSSLPSAQRPRRVRASPRRAPVPGALHLNMGARRAPAARGLSKQASTNPALFPHAPCTRPQGHSYKHAAWMLAVQSSPARCSDGFAITHTPPHRTCPALNLLSAHLAVAPSPPNSHTRPGYRCGAC